MSSFNFFHATGSSASGPCYESDLPMSDETNSPTHSGFLPQGKYISPPWVLYVSFVYTCTLSVARQSRNCPLVMPMVTAQEVNEVRSACIIAFGFEFHIIFVAQQRTSSTSGLW